MMGLRPLKLLVLGLVFSLTGCVVYHDDPGYQHQQAQPAVKVPPGHMPPPGLCRIWLPDTPPGHQPPVGNCNKLRHQVPPGATLIYG